MWPFKRKGRPINAPGTVWDGVEAPDDELIAGLKDFKLPTDEMTQLFQRAVQKVGEEAALDAFLKDCDFKLARDEMADAFRFLEREAKQEGKEVWFKEGFVEGWDAFAANPNADTARAWLRVAPDHKAMIQSYLVESCPGGTWAYHAALKKRR